MLLSILIPVYNWHVGLFVESLLKQAQQSGAEFEIIVADDNSDVEFKEANRCLRQFPKVKYRELNENLGRASIRNWLAGEASGDYLLFLDGDSMPENDNFIQAYLERLPFDGVLCGGTSYPPKRETDMGTLRWTYGMARECLSVQTREQQPHLRFMSNNFLLPRKIFLNHSFDASLRDYGHEDTLLGLRLMQAHVPIAHIHNPLQHRGIESNAVFLAKTKVGLKHLWRLYQSGYPMQFVKVLNLALRLKRWGIAWLVLGVLNLANPILEQNVLSGKPNLWCFDLVKLRFLLQQMQSPVA